MFGGHGMKRNIVIVLYAFMFVICADLTFTLFATHLDTLSPTSLVNVTVDLIGCYICMVLYGTIVVDRRRTVETYDFLLMIFLVLLILFADASNWMLDGEPDRKVLLMVANIGLFILILFISHQLWKVVVRDLTIPEERLNIYNRIIHAAMAIGIVNALTTPLTGFIFYIDDAGYYVRGWGIIISNLPVLTVIMTMMVATLLHGNSLRRKLTVVAYTVAPFIATALQLMFYGLSFLYISLILTLLLIYGNYYVTRGTDMLKLDAELTEERFNTMYSQIQPHFLYNTLTSIMAIKGNPQETVDAIADFGKYLRGNLDTLSTRNAIPVRKELEHVEIYVDLERMRFKDKLEVEFDLRDRDFFVPALSIQMLVENSIKHGVTAKEEGGHVKVTTFSDDSAHYIVVEDDGVGFDTLVPPEETVSHVGLNSVRRRLDSMVGGKLEIDSTVGKGTVATIVIPRKGSH